MAVYETKFSCKFLVFFKMEAEMKALYSLFGRHQRVPMPNKTQGFFHIQNGDYDNPFNEFLDWEIVMYLKCRLDHKGTYINDVRF